MQLSLVSPEFPRRRSEAMVIESAIAISTGGLDEIEHNRGGAN